MRELRCQRRLLSGKAVRFLLWLGAAKCCDASSAAYVQEASNTTVCDKCPDNTGRRIGVLNGSTRLSCMCKEGDPAFFLLALPWPTMRYMVIRLVERWCAGGCVSKHRRCGPSRAALLQVFTVQAAEMERCIARLDNPR